MCEINRSRYSAYLLHVHVVFMTKYRRPVFGELHHANMRQYVAEVCADFGAELKECDGEADHVHMLIEYPPLVQLTKLVNSLKSVTSSMAIWRKILSTDKKDRIKFAVHRHLCDITDK